MTRWAGASKKPSMAATVGRWAKPGSCGIKPRAIPCSRPIKNGHANPVSVPIFSTTPPAFETLVKFDGNGRLAYKISHSLILKRAITN